jgi:hypothetical protein
MQVDRDRLKLIIKNLKLLVDALECEIYSDIDLYKQHIEDDRLGVTDDDDGYPD